jgi:ribosomal protein S18 acetylase RimI-like enzyme
MTRPFQGEIKVRRIGVDDWPLWRILRLQALEEAPYAFSSRLADWQGLGDTEARWRGRVSDVPLNIVAEWQESAAGMASGTVPNPDGSVELISMWVAPFARGRGVGDALVNAVIEWAREQRASSVVLGVLEGNERAEALYRRHGFLPVGPELGTVTERRMARDFSWAR